MFGRESKPCMVYEYGCLAPVSGEEDMLNEMRRRNELWNKLVEIDRDYRAKVREVLKVPEDPVAPLKDELTRLREEIKSRRKAGRSGKTDVAALQDRIGEIKIALETARREAREAKKVLADANRAHLNRLDDERKALVKEAVRGSGLYWCNSDDVVAGYEAARKRAMRQGTDLRFHRWTGEGKVFVRYQYGLPVADVFGTDTRLQIDPVPDSAWNHPQRRVRRKAARTRVRLRVTSESRNPVWVELPMVMHRPLPPEGEIRSAAIIRERVGRSYRHKLVVTVAISESSTKLKPQGGAVAIDVGWRQVRDGLRVAYWTDEAGESGQLVLPPKMLAAFTKLPDLKSIRDQRFNEAKEALASWLADNKVPDWLTEAAGALSSWRSQGRLAALVKKWRENGFTGDETILKKLEDWLMQENRLYDWEANLRDQVKRYRREEYRKFAAWLAGRYNKVVLEDFDLRKITRKPAAEEGTLGSKPQDRQRTIAAISELRQAIENACRRKGVEVVRVEASHTTVKCHMCGRIEKFDTAGHLFHTCSACGTLYDQDYNAAINLLLKASKNNGVSAQK